MLVRKCHRKTPDKLAVQWLKENEDPILAWLTENGVMYSYHEIASGGELIVYANGTTHPVMIREGYWILLIGTGHVDVVTNEVFEKDYECEDTD